MTNSRQGNIDQIDFREMLNALALFRDQSTEDTLQLKYLFRVYDKDGDGYIGQSEMFTILRKIVKKAIPALSDTALEEIVDSQFKEINPK